MSHSGHYVAQLSRSLCIRPISIQSASDQVYVGIRYAYESAEL